MKKKKEEKKKQNTRKREKIRRFACLLFEISEVRDAKLWSHYINESIEFFFENGDADTIFAGHQWPTWGRGGRQRELNRRKEN